MTDEPTEDQDDDKVRVVVRSHKDEWPPVADETAEVPLDAADHWNDRLWHSGPF